MRGYATSESSISLDLERGTIAIMALVSQVAVFAALFWLGGWYWSLVAVPMFVAYRTTFLKSVLLAAGPGLLWLTLFVFTGDRRMFFPFTVYQSVLFGQLWRHGFAAGVALVIGLFTMIRIEQEASFRVLIVELVVAVAGAFLGAACRRFGPVAAACGASLVALAGLTL